MQIDLNFDGKHAVVFGGTSGINLGIADQQQEKEAREHVPMKRFGTLDDIANLTLFLASDHAGFISDAVVPCDGGGALESVKPALEAAGRQLASRGPRPAQPVGGEAP